MSEASAEAVICGAGIAGISAAYHLSRHLRQGRILLIDERAPFSLTSDKSTECYRNWWPGPDAAMVRLMNRSIDLLEALADDTGNAFHLNRRGYLYLTADVDRLARMQAEARATSALGAGAVREHSATGGTSSYHPAEADGFRDEPSGADWITDLELLQRSFPGLSPHIVGGLHVRRAGWFSGQQLSAILLDRARKAGVELLAARLIGVDQRAGQVSGVRIQSAAGTQHISTRTFVDAAGPFVGEVALLLGVQLPVYHELHAKVAFSDSAGAVGRGAPLMIWQDSQTLEWSAEERQVLQELHHDVGLLGLLPSGLHLRPEGGPDSRIVLALWPYHTPAVPARWPLPLDPAYAEVVLRGLATMLPRMRAYQTKPPRPFVDGGYYTRTRENRPLIGRMGVEGAYVMGAMSGFGLMAAMASGELLAAHALGQDLPDYAEAFSPQRYDDPAYLNRFAAWEAAGQL